MPYLVFIFTKYCRNTLLVDSSVNNKTKIWLVTIITSERHLQEMNNTFSSTNSFCFPFPPRLSHLLSIELDVWLYRYSCQTVGWDPAICFGFIFSELLTDKGIEPFRKLNWATRMHLLTSRWQCLGPLQRAGQGKHTTTRIVPIQWMPAPILSQRKYPQAKPSHRCAFICK